MNCNQTTPDADTEDESTPSELLFEKLHHYARSKSSPTRFHDEQRAAVLATAITEVELFVKLTEQLALSFLLLLEKDIFNPRLWFVEHPPTARVFERAGSTKLSTSFKTQRPRKKRHHKIEADTSKPTLSPFFQETKPTATSDSTDIAILKPKKAGLTTSPYFYIDPFATAPTPKGLNFELQPSPFGLIQERIRGSLFALVLQAILWNQTTAKAARPVLFKLLCTYPTPESLAVAKSEDIYDIIRCLGLQARRTATMIELAKRWVAAPPCPTRRYARKNYPNPDRDMDHRLKDGELLDINDKRPGWEIAHLPGIGPYALDSYRIFYRDTLWGIEEGDGVEPEWKRVIPEDKELAPYVAWKWRQEGWDYDIKTGTRTRIGWKGQVLTL